MELKEEFKKRPKEQEEGEKREDLKGQIVELKKIVALQSVQIDSLKEDISILLGVFTKYAFILLKFYKVLKPQINSNIFDVFFKVFFLYNLRKEKFYQNLYL